MESRSQEGIGATPSVMKRVLNLEMGEGCGKHWGWERGVRAGERTLQMQVLEKATTERTAQARSPK